MVTLSKVFFLLYCSALLFPSSAVSDVYRQILPDGTPVFTDRPTGSRYSLVIRSHDSSSKSLGSAPAQETRFMYGLISCGQWVSARKAKGSGQFESWVMGYLSGANAFSKVDILTLAGGDTASYFLYIDKQCANAPLEDVGHHAGVLFCELATKAGQECGWGK